MGVFTVAGGKGGVGKSTTTASLGTILSEAGFDVALVDADLAMANLADVVGGESEQGIHHVLAGRANVEDVIVEVSDGLDIVPGGDAIELFAEADPANLREVVVPLDAAYDVVLVDTGAGLGHETLVATGLADATLLVTTPDDAAVADVAKTAEFVGHADATVVGAVVTRTDPATDLGAIAGDLGVPLLGTVPQDATVGTDPVTSGDVGRAYRALAATLLTEGGHGPDVDVGAPASLSLAPGDDIEPTEPKDAGVAPADGLFSFGD